MNLLVFEKGTGKTFNYFPYEGSAPTQNAAVCGKVQVVITSLAEQQQLLRAERLRPLAMLVETDMDLQGIGTFPSAFTP